MKEDILLLTLLLSVYRSQTGRVLNSSDSNLNHPLHMFHFTLQQLITQASVLLHKPQHVSLLSNRIQKTLSEMLDLGCVYICSSSSFCVVVVFFTQVCLSVCQWDVWCSSAFVMVDCSAFQTRNEDQACFQWASIQEGYRYVWVILLDRDLHAGSRTSPKIWQCHVLPS